MKSEGETGGAMGDDAISVEPLDHETEWTAQIESEDSAIGGSEVTVAIDRRVRRGCCDCDQAGGCD